MLAKTVTESSVVIAQVMNPQDANPAGNVHGGVIMKLIDTAAGVVATRHALSNVVTASIDRLDFISAVYVGDLVFFKASINYCGRTSMEIGVRIEAENMQTGDIRHTGSAYLTFVALDDKGCPKEVAPLDLKTAEENRRHSEAIKRRDVRLAEKHRERQCQSDSTKCEF